MNNNFVANIKVVPGFSTSIDTQHLSLQGVKPVSLGMLTEKLFVQQSVGTSPLYAKLLNEARTEGLDNWPDIPVKYPVAGYQTIHILGDAMPPGTAHGKNGDEFYIWTVENILVPSDEISPGDVNYQARIQTPAEPYKGGFRYRAKAKFTSLASSIPAKYFAKNAKWNKMWASGEEGNQQKGSTFFPGRPLSTSVQGGKINKHFKMTDFAGMNDPNFHCVVEVSSGNRMSTSVLTWGEKIAAEQFAKETNRYILFNLPGKDVFGSTNRAVPYATGIYHQIKQNGWFIPYQKLTAKFIKSVTKTLFMGRVGYESGELWAYAGSLFIEMFNEANIDNLVARNMTLSGDFMVKKVDNSLSRNGLQVGAQVVSMLLSNNKVLNIIHEPAFDDPELWTEKDPVTGYPLM